MISCEQCQKKLVAIYDNEDCKGDVELTNCHLKDCPACRAFREDMISIRKRFVSAAKPCLSKNVETQLIQTVRADSLHKENRYYNSELKHQPVLLRLPRAVWISGLAGLFLLIVSWLACFTLSKEVSELRDRLEVSGQKLAAIRHDLAVAQASKQLEESREKEQKAISALYFRMRELEERFDQYSSLETTFLPAQQNRRSDRSGGM